MYFSDIAANRIYKLAPDGTRSVFREPSGRTNGNTFDAQGRLLHCEGAEFGPGGGRRITRSNVQTGAYEVLTERFDGARYNSPNDICVDGAGRIYFTDPCYGDRSQMEMSMEGVYRIDLDGSVHRILAQPDVQRPNGIAVTQDNRLMYVVDSCPVIGGNRKIWAFDLDSSGNPSNQRLVFDFGSARGGDGMRLDVEGNLYICAGITAPRGPHESADAPPGCMSSGRVASLSDAFRSRRCDHEHCLRRPRWSHDLRHLGPVCVHHAGQNSRPGGVSAVVVELNGD